MDARQVFGALPAGWEERLLIKFCPRCAASCDEAVINGLARSRCTSCSYLHFVNPTPRAAVVVTDGDRVLLCRRAGGLQGAGLWNLPQGHIEYHEDFITAGLREVLEETGLEVEIKGLLSVVSNLWEHGGSTLDPILLAEVVGGTARPDSVETTEVGWSRPDELPSMSCEADVHIIQRYFEAREAGACIDPDYARHDAPGASGVKAPTPAARYSG